MATIPTIYTVTVHHPVFLQGKGATSGASLWSGEGPPPEPIVMNDAYLGDHYLDLLTGKVYILEAD